LAFVQLVLQSVSKKSEEMELVSCITMGTVDLELRCRGGVLEKSRGECYRASNIWTAVGWLLRSRSPTVAWMD
jgi:hypothetical protein